MSVHLLHFVIAYELYYLQIFQFTSELGFILKFQLADFSRNLSKFQIFSSYCVPVS